MRKLLFLIPLCVTFAFGQDYNSVHTGKKIDSTVTYRVQTQDTLTWLFTTYQGSLKAPLISPSLVTPAIGAATGTSLYTSGNIMSTTDTLKNKLEKSAFADSAKAHSLGVGTLTAHYPVRAAGTDSMHSVYDGIFNVMDYGAVGDGSTDDLVAVRSAVAAAKAAGGGKIHFPEGNFKLTDSVLVDFNNCWIAGDGSSSIITFVPASSGKTCFVLSDGAREMWRNKISDLMFIGNNAYSKTAIKAIDTRQMILDNLKCSPWHNTADSSSWFIKLYGRDGGTVSKISFWGDNGILIGSNPNSWLSLDTWHFEDMALGFVGQSVKGIGYLIEDSAYVSRIVWDGYQSIAGAKCGVWFVDSTGVNAHNNLQFHNMGIEQTPDGGRGIYIRSTSHDINSVSFFNCVFAVNTNPTGFALDLQNIWALGFYNCGGGGGPIMTLDYIWTMVLVNNLWNTADTWTFGGGRQITCGYRVQQGSYSASDIPNTGLYQAYDAAGFRYLLADTIKAKVVTGVDDFTIGGAFSGSAEMRGDNAFVGTAATDTVTVSGAGSDDFYMITLKGYAAPSANDAVMVQNTATGFVLHRAASGTSGLAYAWFRVKY
jgi:hypothetical protein